MIILFFTFLTFFSQAIGSEMIFIPGGEFTMGADYQGSKKDEHPPHLVKVSAFWIDKTPVTNKQFKEFVDATGYVTTAEKAPSLEEIMEQVPKGTPPPAPELLVALPRLFLNRQKDQYLSPLIVFGGIGNKELTGNIRSVLKAQLLEKKTIQSCKFPGMMQMLMQNGLEKDYRLKLNGNLQLMVAKKIFAMFGGMRSFLKKSPKLIFGKESSLTVVKNPMDM